jgi:hypothetical protein
MIKASTRVSRHTLMNSLFCLSFLFVITVGCTTPITLAKISSSAKEVVLLINASEKALYVVSNLVNASYEALGQDIRSENFKTGNKSSNKIIEKMEARHSELVAKHQELDNSLSATNTASNKLFSMLENRANQNSQDSLKKQLLRDISAKKEVFSEKIEVAEDASSKLKTAIKGYDDILGVLQVSEGLKESQKYIGAVESVTAQYELLEQEVQVALREGRQVIADVANISPEETQTTVSKATPQNSEPEVSAPPPETETAQPSPERPLLGVKIANLTPELRQQINQQKNSNLLIDLDQGVLIVEIEKNSLAARVGIQVGDIITKINNKPVIDVNEFISEIDKVQIGTDLSLDIRRNQQDLSATVPFR